MLTIQIFSNNIMIIQNKNGISYSWINDIQTYKYAKLGKLMKKSI